MDVAQAVEVLFLDPEGAADAAVVLDLVPERADMGLKAVAHPGPPARELALGRDMQVGAAGWRALWSSSCTRKWPFNSDASAL